MACCELSHSIFVIILKHTLNTKLAMFLCDRAKTLFIEYINISYEMGSNKNINLIDIKIYIYSKTIGPLQLSKYEIDRDMDMNSTIIEEQKKIAKMNDLFILYKQFIYNIYTYLINNIDKYNIITDNVDDDDDNDGDDDDDDVDNASSEEALDTINTFSKSNLIIEFDDKYKNDHICNTLEMIRVALDAKIFKSFLVFNILYLEELLHIDFESYSNIYIPINKLSIQLEIIINGKQTYEAPSNKIYSIIQSFKTHEYDHFNNTFINSSYIHTSTLYNKCIKSLQ